MGRNLIGYFAAQPDCEQYSVKIISNPLSNDFEEIYLAGDSPFVVTYDTANTPFEPVRFSRASINVVADEKFFDVFSEDAQGTKVVLSKVSGGSIEWVGYLTSNLLNMPDSSCGDETFTLEAQDCLSTLENYDYTNVGNKKAIVSFRQIMSKLAIKCGQISTLYVDMSMMRSNGTYISLNDLTISEQNFYSSDTDEPWNMREVLEHICKYLGYTATQYKDCIYLYDMQSHAGQTWQSDTGATMIMNCYRYRSTDGFVSATQGSFTDLAEGHTLRQAIFKGTGADISLETLYNKVVVKDSFYEVDHFIPDIFEDASLTNRLGDFWKSKQLGSTRTFTYLNKKGKPKNEEKSEGDFVHYIRKFDHKDYTSVYRNTSTLAEVTINNYIACSNVSWDFQEDTQQYQGTYTISATIKNNSSASHSIKVTAELRYEWWDENAMMYDYNEDQDTTTFTLAAGASKSFTLTCNTWYDGRPQSYYDAYYTIDGGSRAYDISENAGDDSTSYIGGTIVDIATFDKPMSSDKYLYETEANINFDRYLMIHQYDMPERQHPYANWNFLTDMTPLRDSQIDSYYPCIFKLNAGYTNPFIYSDNAFLYLDAQAIFERYNVEWINTDWTDENTNMNGLGLFRKTSSITTITPCLIFKLKVGNKYWSTQSGWTTTNSCFVVKLGTDKTDEDDVDFTGWWNEEHPVLNNVEWTEWSGAKGYKIPLEVGLDMNQDIVFEVHMPSKMQVVKTNYSYDGMNNYCWVKDLKLEFATKDSENYDMADVVYENVIDSGSVNTLSDIQLKITTYPGDGMHSYSNVALDGALITGMTKIGLDGGVHKPEENIIEAYSNQYSFPTIKQNMTLDLGISPFSRIKDPVLDKYFGIIGQKYDYAKGSQEVNLIETRPWSLG